MDFRLYVCLLGGPGLLNRDSSVSGGFRPLSAGKGKYQDSKQMDSGAEDCNVIVGNPAGARARGLYAAGRNTTWVVLRPGLLDRYRIKPTVQGSIHNRPEKEIEFPGQQLS